MADVLTMVARLQNETQAGFSQIKKDIETITHGSPLKQLAAGLANLGKALLPFTRVVKDALTPSLANLGITSLTVSGAIGGLYYGMQKVAQSAIQMRVVADLSGFSEEFVQKAVHVARGMGISQEQISSTLLNFGKLNQQLSGGPNKEPIGEMKAHIENLEQRGEKGKELARKIREHGKEFEGSNPEGLFALVTDPVQGIMNMKGRLELMPMFQFPLSMTDQWNQRMKEAPKQTAAAKKATEDYNEQWNQFVEAGEEFGRAFFNVFGPPMTALLDAIADKLNDILLVLKLLEKAVDWILPGWLKDLIGWKGDLFGIPNLPDVISRGLAGVGGGGLGGLAGKMPIPGAGNTSNPQGPGGHSPVRTGYVAPMQGGLARGERVDGRDLAPDNLAPAPDFSMTRGQWWMLRRNDRMARRYQEKNRRDMYDDFDPPLQRPSIELPRAGGPGLIKRPYAPGAGLSDEAWEHRIGKALDNPFVRQHSEFESVPGISIWESNKRGRSLPLPGEVERGVQEEFKGDDLWPTLRDKEQYYMDKRWQFGDRPASYNNNAFSNPQSAPPSTEGIDRAIQNKSGERAKIEGSGTVTVDVTAPPGTKVDAEGGGMFDTTTINRSGGRLQAPAED